MNLDHNQLTNAGEILIVDDNLENLKYLMDILKKEGYRVRPATDGELALRSVKAKSPVLILLDIFMPNMDGFEVCRQLKADETTRSIPIIFLSALSDTDDKVKGFELGAVDYLTKPLSAPEILARVATHLSLFVTHQRLAAQNRQLLDTELRYKMVADFTYAWEFWLGPDGQCLYCSPSCLRISGYEAAEFITNPLLFFDIAHPDDKQLVNNHLELTHSANDFTLYSLEYRIYRKDGMSIWVEHACQAVCDQSGTYRGRRVSIRDISERKKIEVDLLKAKNAAESANVAKSTFIATMSHELRTPLNAILGFSELMSQDQMTTPAQKEILSIINRSGAHLLNMINDVLEISKIEADRLELNIQPFNFISLLQDIGNMISVRAAKKQLSFNLEISSDVPQFIQADAGKLRQTLINLLGNAIKFTQQGGLILRVQAQSLPIVTMTMLIIEVVDSGMGITPEQQQELFRPFVQLTSKSSDVQGTGLGLAISKSLVDLMGGDISVSSIIEVGSIFKVELPVTIASANDITVEAQDRLVTSIAADQPHWRLLVVDDNSDNRLLLIKLLSDIGFQVREAENGQDAIRVFEQWQPHLIWMDMRMPVMDGYETTAKIRQLKGGHDVKVIALTASAFREQHASIIRAGCDEVLHKPFHISEIFTVLTNQLGVKFIYRDQSELEPSVQNVTVDMLMTLPQALRQQLHDAALHLDIEETDAVIENIRTFEPDIAQGLQELSKCYRFDRIIHLTEELGSL